MAVRHDREGIKKILETCEVTNGKIVKVQRLGKYDQTKQKRPLLATLGSLDEKLEIFRKISKLKNSGPRFSSIRISNDLTKAEREHEKKLFDEAKRLEVENSGEAIFRVKGPPWARKIVKVAK